jgi:REP element-mobilizing transposase RayT
MARAHRIKYKGAWYHVMNRGAGRKRIYHTEKDYEIFLELLKEITNRYHIAIHAYCLMPNHYHLLANTPLTNLSEAMRHLNGLYTRRFNKSRKIDGPLFRGRFKSVLIEENKYFRNYSLKLI